jgi:integrase
LGQFIPTWQVSDSLHAQKAGGHLTDDATTVRHSVAQVRQPGPGKTVGFLASLQQLQSWRTAGRAFKDRKQIMKILCDRAGVQYFRFHALRHAGASVLDKSNVPIGTIQRILGHENRTTTEIYYAQSIAMLSSRAKSLIV